MKTSKRISALLLALCLVLGLTVPAVWAEEATVVEYNFDYYAKVQEIKGEGKLPEGNTAHASYGNYASLGNTELISEIQGYYADGSLNWSYEKQYKRRNTNAYRFGLYVYSQAYTNKSTNYKDYGFMRFNAQEGDWLAFKIKNPGKNTTWSLALKHPTVNGGAEICNIYILPVGTDINTAIDSQQAVGEVRFYNSSSTSGNDVPNIAMSTSDIGLWTSGEAEEYILVLYAAKASDAANNNANLYISSLTMRTDTKAAEEAEAILYHSKTDGGVSNGKGKNFTTYCTLSKALSSAASTDRICLLQDAETTSATVPENVELELNGHTLTATEFTCSGTLTDNTDGNGMVETIKGKMINVADGDLLLYDSTNTGYRVYSGFELTPYGESLQPVDGGQRLWIKLTFDNKDAYRVIATGYSEFAVGASMTWTPSEGTAVTNTLIFNDDHEKTWGTNMQTSENYGFYITFTGFDYLASGELSLTPVVSGCTETDISSRGSITYTHTAG